MKKISIIGLDIAKNIFEVSCQDDKGNVVRRSRLRRGQVLLWFAEQAPCQVGLEACGGAHYWAREIKKRGHDVKIIPPQHVKPFVRANKNDCHDAKAIGRALREPDMPFVSIAAPEHQDGQALHRVRSRLIKERTSLVNQLRGFLMEYGIVLPKRIDRARKGFQMLIQDPPESLSHRFRSLLEDHWKELCEKDRKIDHYSTEIEGLVNGNPAGIRVRKIRGVGPLSASALLLKIRHASSYRNGRHFSASLGLVPRHEGTGGHIKIKGMSKRGDRYLRTLLIHGARSVVAHCNNKKDGLSVWIQELVRRRGINKAVVALANKNARIAWRLIAKEDEYNPELATKRLLKVA